VIGRWQIDIFPMTSPIAHLFYFMNQKSTCQGFHIWYKVHTMPAASNAMCSSQLQELYIPLRDNLAEEHVHHHSIKSFLFERQER
jgi:hypothetical protein